MRYCMTWGWSASTCASNTSIFRMYSSMFSIMRYAFSSNSTPSRWPAHRARA